MLIALSKLMLRALEFIIMAIFYSMDFHEFVPVGKSDILDFAIEKAFQINFRLPENFFTTVILENSYFADQLRLKTMCTLWSFSW